MMQSKKQNNLSLTFTHQNKINNLLSPIFDAVRANKINSYYQFRKFSIQSHHNQSSPSHYIFSPKKYNDSSPINNKVNNSKKQMAKTFYNNDSDGFRKKMNKTTTNRMNATAYSNLNRKTIKTPNTLKSTNTRQSSKIKKHLVENIDFQEIQKMLYKKRDWVTRYQYFTQKIHHNRRKNQNKAIQKEYQTLDPDKPLDSLEIGSQKQQISQANNTHTLAPKIVVSSRIRQVTPEIQEKKVSFRTTPRKKFWARQGASSNLSPRKNRLSDNPQICQLVQGRSYKMLSPQEIALRKKI